MHWVPLGDCAACRQMKLNSNKHKVMHAGKSNLRWEWTSVCSKFAAASENKEQGTAQKG
jgi:hypothetical protein